MIILLGNWRTSATTSIYDHSTMFVEDVFAKVREGTRVFDRRMISLEDKPLLFENICLGGTHPTSIHPEGNSSRSSLLQRPTWLP